MSALTATLRLSVVGVVAAAATASADPTSGVDAALFRGSYDAGGVFAVEGARLLPARDLSFKVLLGHGRAPLELSMPGIGDAGADRILEHATTLDMTFGLSITDRLALGLGFGAYRTATGAGYGVRGRYIPGGTIGERSTGLIALRPLSNIDPSADPSDSAAYLGDGLAGPLDARVGLKLGLLASEHFAITAIGSMSLPFGEDEMLLGDRGFVFEPRLAIDWRLDQIRSTRVVTNLGARFRQRTVLESYDASDPAATESDAQVVFDLGSELVAGLGVVVELTPRWSLAGEAQVFVPLPETASFGACRRSSGARCDTITSADYVDGVTRGDRTTLATVGTFVRLSTDVSVAAMVGAGFGGARADDLRITTGLVWAPQPAGVVGPGRADRDDDGVPDGLDACPDEPEDRDGYQDEDGCPDPDNDGDGIPDASDQCPDEPEDRDGYQDEDGCPDPDNDGDGIPDVQDKCPDQAEDIDGFEDADGCLDEDNDGDGIPDVDDKCPNDPETVNGFEDEDGCPDVRSTSGPEERADRIDLKGAPVSFARGTANLTAPARQLLAQVAQLIQSGGLAIRIEVHVPLGTKARGKAQIAAQKRRDKQLAQRRARAVLDYLVAQGVPAQQLRAVALGSDRPLGTADPTDPIHERVDFIKSQQGGAS